VVLKLVFLSGLALFGLKLFFRTRFRELAQRLDHAVNVAIVGLCVTYIAYFLWRWLGHG
jgi:hypothetical protein